MAIEGKVVVVTGASRGLGLCISKEFAANGWHVIGIGRSDRPADFPEGASYRQFDASDAQACEQFWKETREQYANAEVCLVNNAGGYTGGEMVSTPAQAYEQQIKSVYFTSVYMTKTLVEIVPQARIVNVVSAGALTPRARNSAYGASKAAQMHFFQALQEELDSSKYQITNLYPTAIASHGPDPKAMSPQDLANLIRKQAENNSTLYLRDVTIYPRV